MNIFTRLICLMICTAPMQVFSAPQYTPHVTLSGHVASFLPQSSRFQRIYGHNIPVYGVEFNIQRHPSWELWTSFDGYSKSGHACDYDDESGSSVTNFTFGIGANLLLRPLSSFEVSLGLGPLFGAIHLDNHSSCSCQREKVTAFVMGGVVRLNTRFWVHPRAFITLFTDYSYQHSFLENNINVGGTKLGGGIGWKI